MMPISEIYVPLAVGFPRDPKVRRVVVNNGIEGMAAAYLYLAMTLYCRENLTDGWVPEAEIGALAYPLDMPTAMRLAMLLVQESLCDPHTNRIADRTAVSMGRGWIVRAYVKRNGTREDVEQRSNLAASAARKRWGHACRNADRNAVGNADRIADRNAVGNAKTESESKESSAGVGDPRAPARPRAREDDAKPDDDDLDGRIVIMLAAHGFKVSREQAAGVRLRILGGRTVDQPGRYVSAALATRDGCRKWAPTPTTMPPRGLDPVTARRAAELRAQAAGQEPLDAAETEDRAHRGAAEARKRLADRPKPEANGEVPAPRALHGPALAAAQAAQSRAGRLPVASARDDDDEADIYDDQSPHPDDLDPSDFEDEPEPAEPGVVDVDLPDYDDEPPF
jgi:hypothetical protein